MMILRMTFRTALAGMLGLCVLSAPAVAQQQWDGQSTPEELRYRLDILDAELADIRARLGGNVGSATQPVPRAGGGGDAAMEGELRRLTAAVEQLQNRVDRIAADVTNRLGDIEFRLTELEGGDGAATSSAPIGGNSAPAPQGQQLANVSVSEQGDLDRAVQDVNQGRFDQAEDRLRQFLDRYQGSPLTGEAWYWLGESQAIRGQQADAAKSFLKGYQQDPGSNRAPHNLFKLGMTLSRLGQINEACLTLREVGRQYPNSGELVRQANAEADQLTCG